MGFPVYALLSDLAVTMVLNPKHFHFLRLLYSAPPVATLQSGAVWQQGASPFFPLMAFFLCRRGKLAPSPHEGCAYRSGCCLSHRWQPTHQPAPNTELPHWGFLQRRCTSFWRSLHMLTAPHLAGSCAKDCTQAQEAGSKMQKDIKKNGIGVDFKVKVEGILSHREWEHITPY